MELKIGGFSIDNIQDILKRKEKEKIKLKNEINKIFSDIYMAKEIFENNYSFALDIWSLVIIIYYLLTGENPSLKDLSRGEVRFPSNTNLSAVAKDLLKQILVNKPENRPTLNQIIYHDFFNRNDIPKYMPSETLEEPTSEFPEEILKKEVTIKDLKSIIKSIIPPITYDSIQNLDEIKKNEAKDIDVYILHYLDYNSKFGVGYLLNNDYIGVYYRDKSLMTLNKNKDDEVNYKDKDEESFSTYQTNNIAKQLDNKYKILKHFIIFLMIYKKKKEMKMIVKIFKQKI
jgi:serine/threonine protein kinase